MTVLRDNAIVDYLAEPFAVVSPPALADHLRAVVARFTAAATR